MVIVYACRDEPIPVYRHQCGRRTVVVGKWGRQLAHPERCPDCKPIYDEYITIPRMRMGLVPKDEAKRQL